MRSSLRPSTDAPGFGTAALLPTLGAAQRASLARGLSVALALSASAVALVYGPAAVRNAHDVASTRVQRFAAAAPYAGRLAPPIPR